MKKFIGIVSLCLVAVMLVSVLASCGVEKKFTGTWEKLDSDGEPTGEVLTLANDGTGSISEDGISGSVNWSVEKDTLFLSISMCGVSSTTEFSYKFSGNTMTLSNEEEGESVYRKKNS